MPPPGGGGGQQGEADNSLAPVWITLGIFIFAFFIWYFFKVYIIASIMLIREFEADLISFFIPQNWAQTLNQAKSFISSAQATNYAGVSFNNLITVSNQVGSYMRWPMAVILAALAYLVYISNITTHYKKAYSMKTLLKAERANWPYLMPIMNLDLVKDDLRKGPWAMSLQPMEFGKKHNLLIVEKIVPSDAILQSKAITIARVIREEARKVFAMQVGEYWRSPEALPMHTRALYAAFAARIAGDRDAPTKLFSQIALSTETGKLDFSGVDELVKKHRADKVVTRIIQKHAFTLTVMPALLEIARQDGVLATSDFLWLKPIDRRLWYMLCSVGRQTPFVEVSGPFAHWIVEKELGRKLYVPMVEEAVNGLEAAMKDMIYKPDEEEDTATKT